MALALYLAAGLVNQVRQGRSLTDALAAEQRLDTAMRAQLQDLCFGCLRRYGWGEGLLAQLLRQPLKDGDLHSLLLVALYRLESRSDIGFTVVDQAVEAAAYLAGGKLKGLVNGVLRNYLRRREALLQGLTDNPEAASWLPQWWREKLVQAYPDQWPAVVEACRLPPPMALRVNLRHIERDAYLKLLQEQGLAATPLGRVGLRLEKPVAVTALPHFSEGWVSVQDGGAQRAAPYLDLEDGLKVLDACAAPGGKSAHILEKARVDLLCLDIAPARCQRIGENLQRLGLTGARVKVGDGADPRGWWDGHPFDRILADVPCSASGVVRRHPDIKWLRRSRDIPKLVKLQRQILEALWSCLAPGGKLLYATCSLFPEENTRQIAAFVDRHPDALRVPLPGEAEGVTEIQLLPRTDGDGHDGFYYALLQKRP